MEKKYLPAKNELLKEYNKNRLIVIIASIIFLACASLGVALFFINESQIWIIGLVTIIFSIFFGLCIYFFFFKNMKKIYNASIVQSVLAEVTNDVNYQYNKGYTIHQAVMGGIKVGPVYKSENLIHASVRGLSMSSGEILTTETKVDNQGNKSTEIYFKGRMLIYELRQEVKGFIEIVDKGLHLTNDQFEPSGLKDYLTGNEEYDSSFTIKSDNQQLFLKLITPDFIRKSLSLFHSTPGKFLIHIHEKAIYIVVYNAKEAYEVTKRSDFYNQTVLDSVKVDMERIFWFIDLLIENTDFLK